MAKCSEILAKFPELVTWVQGNQEIPLDFVSGETGPQPGSLVYLQSESQLKNVLSSQAHAVILAGDLIEKAQSIWTETGPTLLTSPQLPLAMALINQSFFKPKTQRTWNNEPIHPSAIVSSTASVGENVTIGPGAVIGDRVVLERDCHIGALSVIESGAQIGAGTVVSPQVFIGHDCMIGQNCAIHPHSTIGSEGYGYAQDSKGHHHWKPHFGKVVLGDFVRIGSGVNIDRGAFDDSVIGEGTKIDNHCHFGHNIRMGKHCLVTAGFISAGSVTVGDHCVFGGRTTVNGHLQVCGQSQFAGMSGIQRTIDKPGAYGGYPIQPLKTYLKISSTLIHLPEMRKSISRLLKAMKSN